MIEKRKCFICGRETKRKTIYQDDIVKIVQCKNCGLIFDEIASLIQSKFSSDIYSQSAFYKLDYLEHIPYRLDLKKQSIKKIENFVSPLLTDSRGKLLDLGCSVGDFLELAREKGWETYGVEVSKYACQEAKNRGIKNIFQGTLEEARFPDNFFDVININHVLVHMKNPLVELREVYRILKPGKYLFIEDNNQGLFRLRQFLKHYVIKHDKPNYRSMLNFFTIRSLKKLLEMASFEIVEIKLESFSNQARQKAFIGENTKSRKLVKSILKLLGKTALDVKLKLAAFISVVARK